MKSQLEEKEETVQKLELEVVGLKKKGKKNESLVKLQDNSIVLDKILDCQRSPLERTGLGYKKNKEKSEDDTWSLKTPVAHQCPKLLPRHLHMSTRILEVQI